MKAKAGLRKIEEALAAKKKKAKKKPYLLWGKQVSGFAGNRGRQNFLWSAKAKTLMKRLAL